MYASGAEVTQQSLKFNSSDSAYLKHTPASTTNRRTMTFSFWMKRGLLTYSANYLGLFSAYPNTSAIDYIAFSPSSDSLRVWFNGSTSADLITTQVFRDPASWYHIVVAIDTTQATSSNRIKIYVNGNQVTTFSTANYPALNYETYWNNSSYASAIGANLNGPQGYFDGYLSDVYFIDGQALDASSFGQFTNGYWKKKDYSGSYGTNGFHLTFQDDVVSEGFNAVTYRGTGTSQSVSGLGLSPDLVWIKQRSGTAFHNVYDSLRIVGGDHKRLYTNATNAEESSTYSGTTNLTSLDGDGFSLGTGTDTNNSGSTYVAWCWDAGSGSPVSNTNGSITSTVKANPSYGFSIVSYTGTGSADTVGHGLSDTPDLIITKQRSSSNPWPVNSGTLFASGNMMFLDRSDAEVFGGSNALASYSNTTFGVSAQGATGAINDSGETYIAYCFHSVAGYSSFGSYSGTGAAGNAVNCGFRPAFIMIKKTDSAADWWMFDTTRDTNNQIDSVLYANLSNAEYTDTTGIFDFEITSNGFVNNSTNTFVNGSGASYIYMAFADTREAAFWKDVSGQGNHWQPNNLDYRDSLIDSPANNFAVMNPLTGEGTAQEGNLKVAANDNRGFYSSFAMESGKWYWEAVMVSGQPLIGVIATELHVPNSVPASSGQHAIFYYFDGRVFQNGAVLSTEASFAAGDIIGVTYDANTYEIKLYKNNSFQRTITANNQYTYAPACTAGSVSAFWTFNFGQDSTFSGARPAGGNQDANNIGDFAYAPPSGFLSLCSANLPTPTIVDGSEHFNTVLWTGDATFPRNISGVGFDLSTDGGLVWIKNRSTAISHTLWDSVRGAGANKELSSNNTTAEGALGALGTTADYGYISSLTSDGFDVAEGATGYESYVNASGNAYAAWNWKAGGTAVSNTDGSITSQVSANVDAGFSIVSYTGNGTAGATIGHGLSSIPDMVILKSRSDTSDWWVAHSGIPNNWLQLDDTQAAGSGGGGSGSIGHQNGFTTTVFDFEAGSVNMDNVNKSGSNYIAYCFANSDIIKAGSYIGNGSTDGTFVYTGFRPAWLMIKETTNIASWYIQDSTRDVDNPVQALYPIADNSLAEISSWGNIMDLVSNGFKPRVNDTAWNRSGGTYIYLAFAETPFKYANAR